MIKSKRGITDTLLAILIAGLIFAVVMAIIIGRGGSSSESLLDKIRFMF